MSGFLLCSTDVVSSAWTSLLQWLEKEFSLHFSSHFSDRYHHHSRAGHFWIENMFLPECYLILTTVDHFYESQLEIP